MVVADSSVWIDLFARQVSPQAAELARLIEQNVVMVPDLVALEVIQGARSEIHAAQLEQALRGCEIVNLCDWPICIVASRNYRTLRDNAITPRNSIDLLIATWCIENDTPLLHKDRDFSLMEGILGLKVWHGGNPSPSLA
jgi:predicted nucleic acid-binding protein